MWTKASVMWRTPLLETQPTGRLTCPGVERQFASHRTMNTDHISCLSSTNISFVRKICTAGDSSEAHVDLGQGSLNLAVMLPLGIAEGSAGVGLPQRQSVLVLYFANHDKLGAWPGSRSWKRRRRRMGRPRGGQTPPDAHPSRALPAAPSGHPALCGQAPRGELPTLFTPHCAL